MSTTTAPPAAFADLVDLASDATGAFAVHATDDYFAEKESLLRPSAPEWIEGRYTERGKWMDGWESQRRREPGHDAAIIRLGTPGEVRGALVDTTHFKGNAPEEVSLEGIEAPDTATARALLEDPGWIELLPRTRVKPDFPNALPLPSPTGRVTHVRLRIHPDGGVARLRVYGVVRPEPRVFWRPGSIDLAAIEHGGTIAAASDQFFGPPSNLLLPGRGVNMGDGWETKRRRTPGSDWCVIRLGRRGVVERVELDTHFFKGNAPQATLIEALDEAALEPGALEALLRAPSGWRTLLSKTPIVQHRRHVLEPDRPMAATHLRVHIFPHGGVNRLRVFGHALDTPEERRALDLLDSMPEPDARALLLSFNGAGAFAARMLARRPFPSVRALFQAAEDAWWTLAEEDWLEAFAAHPRLGQPRAAATQTARSAEWSRGEQSAMSGAAEDVGARLASLNERYHEKFGFIFILFASGRTAPEVLERLLSRIENDRAAEIENAAREQAKITRLRIGKWLLAH
ncbi:MAG: allantoicase [Polyangiaceae bacterium]|nr:allantoicase [Polyangiaceae bacterium]